MNVQALSRWEILPPALICVTLFAKPSWLG
jgi:hypothetical protein